jgi:predicted DCC family thiol-disulfide oxidoreductase YuxK
VERRSHVILYTKPGCHLCDEMKEEILRADCAELYRFDEVNIETDSALLARYRYEIPVLLINGVEAFRHRLCAEDFRAELLGKGS